MLLSVVVLNGSGSMAGDGDAVNENVFNFSGRGFDVSVFDEAN